MQAGTRVQDLADQLRPHGLTLQNYASIREQTIGGFTQVRGCLSAVYQLCSDGLRLLQSLKTNAVACCAKFA